MCLFVKSHLSPTKSGEGAKNNSPAPSASGQARRNPCHHASLWRPYGVASEAAVADSAHGVPLNAGGGGRGARGQVDKRGEGTLSRRPSGVGSGATRGRGEQAAGVALPNPFTSNA